MSRRSLALAACIVMLGATACSEPEPAPPTPTVTSPAPADLKELLPAELAGWQRVNEPELNAAQDMSAAYEWKDGDDWYQATASVGDAIRYKIYSSEDAQQAPEVYLGEYGIAQPQTYGSVTCGNDEARGGMVVCIAADERYVVTVMGGASNDDPNNHVKDFASAFTDQAFAAEG